MAHSAKPEHVENKKCMSSTAVRRRYEFRCWPLDPPPAVEILKRDWTSLGHEVRTDTYIVSPMSRHCLAKIRGGSRLELKLLIGPVDILQLWELAYSLPLPIAPSAAKDLASALRATQKFEGDAPLYASQFVDRLKDNPRIKLAKVKKRRNLFEKGTCRAEITDVQFQNWENLSIALEDRNAENANSAVATLRLSALPNRSYGDVLINLSL